ncbi:MAG: glycerol-3-phosphate 1-O-acyltransferase PlsY [Lachnospiraceae bacterium]
MLRILMLLIGYCCGLMETGAIYAKMKGVDLRSQGSGNVGATNSLRVLGKKAGLIVLLGDALKCFIPAMIVLMIFKDSQPEMAHLYSLYLAAGAILGHNFPFYNHFKGGKGVACTAGLILTLGWQMIVVEIIVFFGMVFLTHYVSVSSLCVMVALVIGTIFFGLQGVWGVSGAAFVEFEVVIIILALLGFYQHRSNIKRLLKGEEKKIW